MTTGKTIALTRWTFIGKVMFLLFNILSRLVITFLPRIVNTTFPIYPPPTFPPGNHKFVFYISDSISVLQVEISFKAMGSHLRLPS